MAPSVDPFRLDPRSVRHAFERAAASYDASAILQREVGQRMAERLVLVKLQPLAILDAGCGTGDALSELSARYPEAFVVGLDLAYAMLDAARRRAAATHASERSLFARLLGTRASARRDPRLVCGDVCHLPLASGTVDLVWSNLTLQWINDAAAAFGEFHRVLRAGGWVIRPGMVYGDDGGLVHGLLTTKAVERGTGVYIGPPGTRWPVVHVDDLAALYLAVATRAAPGTIWHGASETVRLDAIATALGGGTAASWPVSEASTELGLLADLFTRDQDVSAAKTRAALGWAPAWTSIVKYLTA